MDNTQLSLKMSVNSCEAVVAERGCPQGCGLGSAGTNRSSSLTIYKKVVDKLKTYGLYENDLEEIGVRYSVFTLYLIVEWTMR